jgi:glycosyltransferase involved in cell wall biosynthesis
VTIPLVGYAESLYKQGINLDLLIISHLDKNEIDFKNNIFNTIYYIQSRRRNKVISIFNQLISKNPYFASWKLESRNYELKGEYDLIWVSPRSLLDIVKKINFNRSINPVYVGGVNDVATLRLEKMLINKIDNNIISGIKLWFQAKLLKKSEIKLLNKMGYIIVQTEEELNWLSKNANQIRCIALPNGVNDELFNIPIKRENRTITFVGNMEGMYKERIRWVYNKILPFITQEYEKITIVGRCNDDNLITLFKKWNSHYVEYIENPMELYEKQYILIAPIFKGYGLINKVVEAMASGTLVIGDLTAFNGIVGFQDGVHGIVAKTEKKFIQKIDFALNHPKFCDIIRVNARKLIKDNLSWDKNLKKLFTTINMTLKEYDS